MLGKYSVLNVCLPALFLTILAGCGGTGVPTAAVTGKITVNGQPVEGVEITFVPEAKIRPSIGVTDANGEYRAQFVSSQSGVALGPCVAQFAIYKGNSTANLLPAKYHANAADDPDLNFDVTDGGVVFDYDIKYDGEVPKYEPPQ